MTSPAEPKGAAQPPAGGVRIGSFVLVQQRSLWWAFAAGGAVAVGLALLAKAWLAPGIDRYLGFAVIGILLTLLIRQGRRLVAVSHGDAEHGRLEAEWQAQAETLERSNRELAHRGRLMRSMLEDLQFSKERVESQAEALQAANVRLEKLSAVKDELVAKVSHELRTPLTSIREGMSLLLDNVLGPTSAEQQDFLKTMEGDVDRLTDFINAMLDISKIESGRMHLQRRAVDLRRLVDVTVVSYQPLVGRRTVRVEGGCARPAFVDPERLRQVLTNLFSNALKHTADEGTIIFRLAQQGDGMVALAVEDNGPGIAPEDLPKLFQKFSQVGHALSGDNRGTGLGLVVCKELVELHRGRIEVASAPGQGATFTVSLPVYVETRALTESFEELQEVAPFDKGQSIGLVAIRVGPGGPAQPASPGASDALERLADEVRRHIHQGDVVLAFEPDWVAVLAATDASGLKAIVNRLTQRLHDAGPLAFGVATAPVDGTEPLALWAQAKARVGGGAALSIPVPTTSPP